jgi:hypothetical protein
MGRLGVLVCFDVGVEFRNVCGLAQVHILNPESDLAVGSVWRLVQGRSVNCDCLLAAV